MSIEVDLFKDNLIDPKKEIEGIRRDMGRGVSVVVARVNNPEYRKLLRKKYKGSRGVLEQDDDVAMEVSDDLMQEVYAFTVLKDLIIDESLDDNGERKYIVKIAGEIYNNGTFNPQVALQLLKNEPFRNKIKSFAEDQQSFLVFGDDAAKNALPQLSAGS